MKAAVLLLLVVLCCSAQHAGNATRLMQERRYSEAAAEFEQALAAEPENDTLRIQYATCLFAEERNDAARAQFEMERRRLGDRTGLIYYLGLLDVRAGRFAEAIAKLEPLELNPVFPKAAYYLGLAWSSSGQTARALVALELAARNNPHDSEIHYRLARLYTSTGRTEDANGQYKVYREAREGERVVEQEAPPCLEALRTKPIDEARKICGRVAAPGDAGRLVLLGRLYVQAGAYSDAVDCLREAAKIDPRSFEASHYLGLSLFALKRYPEALIPLQKAAELNPQYFDTLNLLAKTLHVLGRDDEALPVLERAHKLDPSDVQVTAVLQKLRAAAASR